MPQDSPFDNLRDLTAVEILSLVQAHLPAWARACEASDNDGIALHESEFGTSATELLLFACAIKVAASNGKNVYVACGDRRNTPKEIIEPMHLVRILREESSLPRHAARKLKPSRGSRGS
jgi:hypothetical protein